MPAPRHVGSADGRSPVATFLFSSRGATEGTRDGRVVGSSARSIPPAKVCESARAFTIKRSERAARPPRSALELQKCDSRRQAKRRHLRVTGTQGRPWIRRRSAGPVPALHIETSKARTIYFAQPVAGRILKGPR